MATRAYRAERVRHMEAPPWLAWAILADSNRWDRVVGCNPTVYTYESQFAAGAAARRVGRTRQMGMDLEWIEAGEWIEGQLMWGERRYRQGPVQTAGFRFGFEADQGGSLVRAEAYVEGDEERAGPLCEAMQGHFGKALDRYFDAVGGLLANLGRVEVQPGEPPVSAARRILLAAGLNALVSGKAGASSEAELEFRMKRLAESPVDEALRVRLVDLVRTRSDDEVRQMRPFEMARAWGLSRRRVLRAYLHAARAGLLDLHWQLVCPTCRVASEVRSSLDEVRSEAHCQECDASYAVDFAENVEAVFSVNAAIRKVEPTIYCAGSPWFRPHVHSALVAPQGKTPRVAQSELPVGELVVRTLRGGGRRARFTVDERRPSELTITVKAHEVTVTATYHGDAKRTAIVVQNETAEAETVLIERAGWIADVVLGSAIVTMPDFHDLFAAEAPAQGVDLSVGSLTLLFSDLSGTTAMYQQMGDARAFALVQEHFQMMAEVVERHEGAVVKTMGDAVMASFASPARALEAALEMVGGVEEAARRRGVPGLTIKIGVHEGPCLAVRANEKIDFFGTTVNVAARLQAEAKGGEVVMMARMMDHPGVRGMVERRGAREWTGELRGVAGDQKMLVIGSPSI